MHNSECILQTFYTYVHTCHVKMHNMTFAMMFAKAVYFAFTFTTCDCANTNVMTYLQIIYLLNMLTVHDDLLICAAFVMASECFALTRQHHNDLQIMMLHYVHRVTTLTQNLAFHYCFCMVC